MFVSLFCTTISKLTYLTSVKNKTERYLFLSHARTLSSPIPFIKPSPSTLLYPLSTCPSSTVFVSFHVLLVHLSFYLIILTVFLSLSLFPFHVCHLFVSPSVSFVLLFFYIHKMSVYVFVPPVTTTLSCYPLVEITDDEMRNVFVVSDGTGVDRAAPLVVDY